MRGRNNSGGNNNNGNRKAPNPLQRSYESNGPDVKVRGTAQHVAEKYLQLARDAQSSGDPVAAENYFQHAEHYYRILLAAQEQMSQQFGHTFPPNRAFVEDADEGEEDGEEDGPVQGFLPGAGPQPDMRFGQNGNGYNGNNPQRAEGEAGEGGQSGQRFDRQGQGQGRDRFNDRNNNNNNRRFDRNDRQDRGERRFDRNLEQGQPAPGGYAPRPDAPRSDIPVEAEQPSVAAATEPGQSPVQGERRFERGPRPERRPRRERPVDAEASDEEAAALPSFLTTPVRVPAAAPVEAPVEAAAEPVAEAVEASAEAAPAKRTRRRRSPREVMDALGQEVDGPAE